jgi:subfamily B ATP-binding cassette protein MsbA
VNSIIERAFVALQKIYQVLDTPSFVVEAPKAQDLPRVVGKIELRNVQFSFDAGRHVLRQINLVAEPGQMIALVGRSGSGKTTLINLLCRFYDVDSGSILIDDVDIRDVKIKSLRRQIAVVMQENMLFGGSLLDNIRYGNPQASMQEVVQAAKAAHAEEFIDKLETGYYSRVGERGVKLSGGQRQRIAIARALLTNPRILIFDEATSALDTESERLIQDAMEKFIAGRTTFVIAHRLSTILKADKIVVLQDGEIVEQGRHNELLQKQGVYRRLYDMQFREPQPTPDDED